VEDTATLPIEGLQPQVSFLAKNVENQEKILQVMLAEINVKEFK
jgi:hypothetical protein